MKPITCRAIAATAATCLIFSAAAPAFTVLDIPLLGVEKAWAGKGNGKEKGGGNGNGNGNAGGNGNGNAGGASSSASSQGVGKGVASSSASSSSSSGSPSGRGGGLLGALFGGLLSSPGATAASPATKSTGKPQKAAPATAAAQKKAVQTAVVPATGPQNTPKAVVRQYVLANGLKQGDVAKALKSWNSLNRSMQAYLNNMDNLASLPGLQVSYIRENMNAQAALLSFEVLGGDLAAPPTEADLLAAQDALAAQAALDAQAVLDAQALLAAEVAAPGTYTQEEIDAATALVSAYEGDPQAVVDAYSGDAQATVDAFAADYAFDPQTVVDQYNAWSDYQAAEATAQDAFALASVSYSGSYDPATLDEVRSYVDAIAAMKGLDTLVAEYDAATAAAGATTTSQVTVAE